MGGGAKRGKISTQKVGADKGRKMNVQKRGMVKLNHLKFRRSIRQGWGLGKCKERVTGGRDKLRH